MMIHDRLKLKAIEALLDNVEEGVHIVDAQGITRVYNKAMESIEGMRAQEVLHLHILEAYKGWQEDNSTLLTALKTKSTIHRQNQKYLNLQGKLISTINTTMPLMDGDEVIGAMELAQNYTDVSNLSEELLSLKAQLMKPDAPKSQKKHYTFDMLIGHNKQYLAAIRIAKRAAQTSSSVMIVGDTGTGKELFAQSIHYESNRNDKPFLAINCAAMPDTLLESLLFGTTKGSFTGALDRPGLFEQANGGTLFLDEINSMSQSLQAKLLRVLQEGYVRRVGGLNESAVDVRIIAATNEQPEQLIANNSLRKDLYYRINVLSINIPSLRDRKEDLPLLVDYFIRYFNSHLRKDIWLLSEEVMNRVKDYEWKGNIRELQNFIESAMNMVQDEHVVHMEHLSSHWQEQLIKAGKQDTNSGVNLAYLGQIRDVSQSTNQSLNEQLEQLERQIIASHLQLNEHNISKTAQSLGLSRQNLQYKLKTLQLL